MNLICTGHLNCNPEHHILYSSSGGLDFIRCTDCGLIWRSPDSMALTKSYSADYFLTKKYLKRRTHKIRKSGWLLDIASCFHPEITEMLEVGCSIGNTLEAAARRGIRAIGTDISEYAVSICNENGLAASNKTLIELFTEGQHFDLIFMQHVLEHFHNPFEVLHTCNQLLNVNGLMLIMVPNSGFRPSVKYRGKHRFYSMNGVGAEHFVYFDYDNLSRMLEFCGFEVVQKNYPRRVKGSDDPLFFLNRIGRRSLALFGADQELLVIARKK